MLAYRLGCRADLLRKFCLVSEQSLWSTSTLQQNHKRVLSTAESHNCETQDLVDLPNFNDAKEAFQAKSTKQLLQSLAVFTVCTTKPFIQNADKVFDISKSVFSGTVVTSAVKATFFKHFCAGETVEDIQPTLQYLEGNGIRGIINYAAEDDVSAEDPEISHEDAFERACDKRLGTFMTSVTVQDNIRNTGFVAIKVTALCQPNLLEKVSNILVARGETLDRGRSSRRLDEILREKLTVEEFASYQKMYNRVDSIAAACHHKGNMRLLVDAEHTYFQPAIDAVTINLQQKYNVDAPVVINTYQCYLKDAYHRLSTDIQRAKAEGWKIGIKTVRGAYIVIERQRAASLGYEDPIQPSLEATHSNYNRCVALSLEAVANKEAELMVASHNQASIEEAVNVMKRLRLQPSTSGVYFGQLLGMADHLTFPLGRHGYRAHKIVPYGPVEETMQYLLRRAQENSDVLGGCGKETSMIRSEILRRLRVAASLDGLLQSPLKQPVPKTFPAA
eukprot:jgi/Botrbrau1/13407/Bobra.0082s0014.1